MDNETLMIKAGFTVNKKEIHLTIRPSIYCRIGFHKLIVNGCHMMNSE